MRLISLTSEHFTGLTAQVISLSSLARPISPNSLHLNVDDLFRRCERLACGDETFQVPQAKYC